mmetsp:Transcript_68058/g.127097  ORF Transcript_68058/g.127097 Transcript_68058/m.127097 type:complete len:247 (-) Transcript_68058:199-939(-)
MVEAGADAPSTDIAVLIGNSQMAASDPSLIKNISGVANRANGYCRFSESEVRRRLAMGDSNDANRVLHVAFLSGKVVGCCSSTLQPPWTGSGCGHWGALAVDPEHQGKGVASALVAAAEGRLLEKGCQHVQIEYEFTPGDVHSERLFSWYEGKLGFSGGPKPCSGSYCSFRRCRKSLSAKQHAIVHSRSCSGTASVQHSCSKKCNEDDRRSASVSTRAPTDVLSTDTVQDQHQQLGQKVACGCALM